MGKAEVHYERVATLGVTATAVQIRIAGRYTIGLLNAGFLTALWAKYSHNAST